MEARHFIREDEFQHCTLLAYICPEGKLQVGSGKELNAIAKLFVKAVHQRRDATDGLPIGGTVRVGFKNSETGGMLYRQEVTITQQTSDVGSSVQLIEKLTWAAAEAAKLYGKLWHHAKATDELHVGRLVKTLFFSFEWPPLAELPSWVRPDGPSIDEDLKDVLSFTVRFLD